MGKIAPVRRKPKVLVAPLDWGLGHATRCIPIIYELLALSCDVLIAAEGPQKELLRGEFPGLRFIDLPGYRIRYGSNAFFTRLRIILQVPRVLLRIRGERRWLRRILRTEKPDGIISDNRYGLHAPGLPSVFITHQLHIRTGLGRIVDGWLEKFNLRAIGRFSTCWVPDNEQEPSLSGRLSRAVSLPGTNIRYIGPLSRFGPCQGEAPVHWLVILSGPEPQRSVFERILLKELETFDDPVVLIRGLPLAQVLPPAPPKVTMFNHVPAGEFRRLVCQAGMVISRAGYSTIMELMLLGKKCILVPTPGQAEQEYLAGYLHEKKLAYSVRQEGFRLPSIMEGAMDFPYKIFEQAGAGNLHQAMMDWLGQ